MEGLGDHAIKLIKFWWQFRLHSISSSYHNYMGPNNSLPICCIWSSNTKASVLFIMWQDYSADVLNRVENLSILKS